MTLLLDRLAGGSDIAHYARAVSIALAGTRPPAEWWKAPGLECISDDTRYSAYYGQWTYQHLMSDNGKWIDIQRSDLLKVADVHGVSGAVDIIVDVNSAIAQWSDFAHEADVPASDIKRIQKHLAKV